MSSIKQHRLFSADKACSVHAKLKRKIVQRKDKDVKILKNIASHSAYSAVELQTTHNNTPEYRYSLFYSLKFHSISKYISFIQNLG